VTDQFRDSGDTVFSERLTDVLFYKEMRFHRSSMYISKNKVAEKVLNGLRTKRVSEKVYRRKRGIARAKGRASKSGV
jgi:hypothetical protein